MSRKIGFGIIGAGMIAELHGKTMRSLPQVELIGIFDTNTDAAKKRAAEFNCKAYTDFDEFLADPAIEAVTIATPSGMHGKVAIAAAKAGKHILCEKPLEITLEKVDAIIRACDENHVLLSPVFQSRFTKPVQLVREAMRSGRFGRMVLASAQMRWYRNPAYYAGSSWRGTWAMDGGGALMNQAIHMIDLLIYINGAPDEVFAFASNIGYKYSHTQKLTDISQTSVTTTYNGDGGTHQLFLGTGIRLFKPLSIGANISYFWGGYNRSITSSSSSSINTLSKEYTVDFNSYKFDLGMQLELPLSKTDFLTLAATWTPGHSLKANPTCRIINSNSTISKADTTSVTLKDGLSIPTAYAFGLAYSHAQNLRVGADFAMQKWGSVDYPYYDNETTTYTMKSGLLKDSYRFNVGAEWTPRPMGRHFFQRVHYRIGAGMATPYYYINGQEGPKELSASIGFGIPIMNGFNNRSVLNISGQIVNRSADNLIKETMFRLNIGFTFNERWFAKWKVE